MGRRMLGRELGTLADEMAAMQKRLALLESAIVAFVEGQSWAVTEWSSQPHIAPLFDIAAEVKGRK